MQLPWENRGPCLFAAVWLVYSVCPPFLSYDSYWSVATALSLLENGNTRLDSYVAAAPPQAEYGLECMCRCFSDAAGWGVFVHAHGAVSIAANQWSALPLNVDDGRWRVWDWHDPQFLRG